MVYKSRIEQRGTFCKSCSQMLRIRENSDNILLICINPKCNNCWINEGSEIIMILK